MLLKQLPARKNGLRGLCFWYKDQDRKIVLIPYAKKSAKQYKVGINKVTGIWPFGRTIAAKARTVSVKSVAPVVAEPVDATTTVPVKSAPALLAIYGATILPFTMLQVALPKNMIESLYVPTFRVGYPV
ncbi:putative dihydrolipoyllysine-residue acetyltransferase [Helianthus annuus]|uniref:Dihydrolipoyllysine-residue acetyltransferase n=1 Tax=Helianthus annuus TaxID=4232 RepID=A0A251TZT4_HELAN|nr:dihydrolipoyllysine-residue acetyltransferase component 4 of pyruvate dehydrogenase complex, chloroplastic [Helianthus annuus]XP_021984202.1 dihydrolipoyllysine-residue acetyltransferase component 4 of pyruvate dehydrogenase complex, chloroplastic [Helianthus annuus]XP_021984203.1 dihydrolipoyllysine-residue acetyltransferase component 4 of pyruvate dehydrogenase complex, chloroplastic [Helianthus annuus]XP_021984204.1 dihydrolipoyllysine-residue acetyltransferase component 4 of pyruvate dehy